MKLLLFVLGAMSLVVQSIVVREILVVVRGSELVLGIVFGSWLMWIAVGSWLGTSIAAHARSAARPKSAHHTLVVLAGFAGLAGLLPLGQVELIRHATRLFGVEPGLVVSLPEALVLAVVATAPFCLGAGAAFSFVCGMTMERSGEAIGALYAAESAGSLLGGLAFAFVLVGRVGHLEAIVLGAALFALALGRLAGRTREGVLVGAVIAATALPVSSWDRTSRERALEAALPGQEVERIIDTPYQQVAVAGRETQLTVYGDGQAELTLNEPYGALGRVAHILAQHSEPHRILVVGNPAGVALELARTTSAAVAAVHPDEALVRLTISLLRPEDRVLLLGRVRTTIDEPRALLARATERFDLVVLDGPEPTSVLTNRFYTTEFFRAVHQALSEDGVLAFALPSASTYVGQEVAALAMSVRASLSSVFPKTLVIPGEESWFFAGDVSAALARDPRTVVDRLARHPLLAPFATEVATAYAPLTLTRFESLLEGSKDTPSNTDDRPSSAYFGALIWDRMSSWDPSRPSFVATGLAFARRAGAKEALLILGLLIAGWSIARRLARRRAGAIDAAFGSSVAGFSAMASNLVILVAFQSSSGALYERVAIVSAVFMLGIAVGSRAFGPVVSRVARARWLVAGVALGTSAFALVVAGALPVIVRWEPWLRDAAFVVFAALAGAFLGASFPANGQVLLSSSPKTSTGRAGGLVNAFDALGAMLGALTVGTAILPAQGARATLHTIALADAAVGLVFAALALLPARFHENEGHPPLAP